MDEENLLAESVEMVEEEEEEENDLMKINNTSSMKIKEKTKKNKEYNMLCIYMHREKKNR